jgi:hypothetical protein
MKLPVLTYLLVSLSDIGITALGIWGFGSHEGNWIYNWINPPIVMIAVMLIIMVGVVVVMEYCITHTSIAFTPYITVAIYASGAFRFIFGTLTWGWLFGLPSVQPLP